MLSYQHGYHAGNFADVIKHLTLSRLINYLLAKNKPLFYLETHSGRGSYDFKDSQATKTGEHKEGISLLWQQREKLSPLFTPYLQIVSQLNNNQELRFYPGSPSLAITMLRPQDRLYCCELHPREFEYLQKLPKAGKRVFFSNSDGLSGLNSLLPPPEKRGLIVIDPSFEVKTDYKTIPQAIHSAYQRFSTGVYCLWYPIVDNRLHEQLLRIMSNIKSGNALRIEFYLTQTKQLNMTGCGLWIINPSFTLAEEMKIVLEQLSRIFNPGLSSYLIEKIR